MSAMIRKRLTPKQALERLEDTCIRGEHSTGEILEKLFRWGIAEDDRNAIVKSLVKNRFVDDSRFARAFVSDRMAFAHWGRRKIAAALTVKRVARDIAADAIAEIDEAEYYRILFNVMSARLRHSGLPESKEEYMKLIRHGVQRGFETDLVVKALKEAIHKSEDVE